MKWELYWILKLDDIKEFFDGSFLFEFLPGLLLLMLVVATVIVFVVSTSDSNEGTQCSNILSYKKSIISLYILLITPLLISSMIAVLLPTTKQFLSIITIDYTVDQLQSNEKIIKTGNQLYELVDNKLTQLLEDSKVVEGKVVESKEGK